MIGQTIAHYRITAALGAGGMGEVYRATDTKLGREVALKILPAEMASHPERLERFQREAKALAALDHPGIVTVHSVEEADGVHFLTMQLVEGQPLDRLIPEEGLEAGRFFDLAIPLLEAVSFAHERGITHRDLKPANMMVTDDGRVKVLDFGLAKLQTTEDEAALSHLSTQIQTREGVIVGTVPYMSPEQLEGQRVDHRTDIFSLGTILFEMATGRRPFGGRSSAAVMSAILKDDPPPLADQRSGLPRELGAVVGRCLAKAPANRYPTTREVLEDLKRSRQGSSVPAAPRLDSGASPLTTVRATTSRGNVPASVDSFVGREKELAELTSLLTESRLLSLVGAGGTGKTRLAVETARRVSQDFAGGTWLVELAPVTQAEAVPHVVADLMGIVPQPGRTLTESLVDALRHRALLLVLDNCEHVLDAAADLASALTTECPSLRILATSRENLAVRGEQVVRLQSLSDADGAELFRDRARAADAPGELDPDTLARLSRRLDGMPLAIELAAARCGTLSPEEIERRLDDRFRLLRGRQRGRMERHQTLRNTVAWSYDLLEEGQRRVFDRLSAFAGGFDLDAARAVAGGEALQKADVEDAVDALVARSMVLATSTEDGTRYRLLETLRQYGEEQLVESGDAPRVHERHVHYFAGFMTRAWEGLWSADDAPWIRAVGHEFENLRLAAHAAIDHGDREALAALLKPLHWWAWHSLRYEVADWAEAALAVSPEPEYARPVAIHLRFHGGRPDDAVRLAAGLRDPGPGADPDLACLFAWGHWNVALAAGGEDVSSWMGRTVEAARRGESVARATALESIQVAFKMMAGQTNEAQRIARETHEKAKATGNQTALCWTHFFTGRAHSDSDPQLALEHFDRSVEVAERHHIPLVGGIAATEAAVVMARTEDPERGWPGLSRAVRSFVDSGDRRQLWTSAHHLAYFLARAGREDDARRVWQELGSRPGYAAQHHRDELTERLGPAGEGGLSDDELVEHIRGVLDGFDQRDPAHRFRSAGEGRAALESPGPPSGDSPSIAVLPFANLSPDPDNQYFSDGLSEEIINALTRLPGLRVIARTSSFRFRGEHDLRKVGEALRVRTLLEGGVRKAGQRLRITAQLIDVADDSHIWSERFDRELDDVFAIQDEISAAIVEKLHLSLGAGRPERRERANVAAFEALLEGRHHFSQFTPEAAQRALVCLERALSLEPDYPDALVLHGFYHLMLAYMFVDPREALPETRRLAERALNLDPHHGEAQAAVAAGAVLLDWDWTTADRLFRRALALAPGSARVHELYGLCGLLGRGRLADALAELDRAVELDPLSALYAGNRGRVLTCSRRFEEAEESCRRGLALDPGQLLAQLELIYALTFQGRFEEAVALGRRAIDAHGPTKAPLNALALALALAGRPGEAQQLLDEPGSGTYRSPLTLGLVHAVSGERDAAFEWVGRAIDHHDPLLMYLDVHPMFDALRADPRYPELRRRVNLSEGDRE